MEELTFRQQSNVVIQRMKLFVDVVLGKSALIVIAELKVVVLVVITMDGAAMETVTAMLQMVQVTVGEIVVIQMDLMDNVVLIAVMVIIINVLSVQNGVHVTNLAVQKDVVVKPPLVVIQIQLTFAQLQVLS